MEHLGTAQFDSRAKAVSVDSAHDEAKELEYTFPYLYLNYDSYPSLCVFRH